MIEYPDTPPQYVRIPVSREPSPAQLGVGTLSAVVALILFANAPTDWPYAHFFGAIEGTLLGWFPLFLACNAARKRFAGWSMLACVLAGAAVGFPLALPLAVVLTIIAALLPSRADRYALANSIPSKEDVERAIAKAEEEWRGLSEVAARVKEEFSRCLHFLMIFPYRDSFGILIFYERDRDIDIFNENGTTAAIADFTRKELSRIGRGGEDAIEIHVEVDSDESVKRDWGGNYFDRLR